MDVHAAMGDDRTLRRIMTMLVALAALAEQAAARSLPVRFLTLCILRHAEVVAWAFVADATGMMRPVSGEVPAAGNGPSDAMLLAARLRALAAALVALLRPGRPFPWNARIGSAPHRFAPGPGPWLVAPDGVEPRPNDTS